MTHHPALEVTITLPLDIVESVVASAKRLGPGHLKPRDRDALEIAEREVNEVRRLLGRE